MSYLPHTDADREAMLAAIGVSSIDDLFAPIPAQLRAGKLDLPPGLCEAEVRTRLETLAARNQVCGSASFLGAGCYNHFVPAAVRALIGRAEFLTAYTPYQAEVSQGTLQHIFEFQTAVCELTGLEVANAGMYDAPSALAEGAFLALRHTRREKLVISAGVHPEARQVVATYASGPGFAMTEVGLDAISGRTRLPDPNQLAGTGALLAQQPNFFGVIEDLTPLAEVAHAAGAMLVVMQNPMTLGLLATPGSQGADVALGDVQVFGSPMSFGGPSAGYLACRQELLRQLPGRLVGQTLDLEGRLCYALTLQAREQHIRRAKATSNICSNQALNALAATVYLALLGPAGLRELGEVCVRRAHYLQAGLLGLPGVQSAYSGPFFHEFALRLPGNAAAFAEAMRARGVEPGVPLGRFDPAFADCLLVAVTEMNTPADLDTYIAAARDGLSGGA
ncbi:MAG: aminomethyl-transferring glycine dehydrogenase subunit GcvPA [Thermoleophilia bacterium]|nr:aminomethyl-transferring glycine dehydrogenase subunit GcvPA [Thermoleophilia bacterium]